MSWRSTPIAYRIAITSALIFLSVASLILEDVRDRDLEGPMQPCWGEFSGFGLRTAPNDTALGSSSRIAARPLITHMPNFPDASAASSTMRAMC